MLEGKPFPQALTIAGSDGTGGAGIQADLKTFQAFGVYGFSVITSVTAQNTHAFSKAVDLSPPFITKQLQVLFEDFQIAAAKTGMLSSPEIILAVCSFLKKKRFKQLVVDPVILSKSGGRLLKKEALEIMKKKLLPMALLVTPNLEEGETLSGMSIDSHQKMKEAAFRIRELGVANVLLKGGDSSFSKGCDLFYDGEYFIKVPADFIENKHPHGTGCVYSAAITAGLSRSQSVIQAIANAKRYLYFAVESSLSLGKGHELLHHSPKFA